MILDGIGMDEMEWDEIGWHWDEIGWHWDEIVWGWMGWDGMG